MMYDQEDNTRVGSRRGTGLGAALALSLGAHLLGLWLLTGELPIQSPIPTLNISFQQPATAGNTAAARSPAPETRHEPENTGAIGSSTNTTAPAPQRTAARPQQLKQPVEPVADPHRAPQPEAQESRPGDARIDRAAIESRVMEALQARFSYPALARRRGWEGRVLLRLDLDAAGRIDRVEVERSSGHRLLDRAALDALKALAGQTPLAEDIGQPLEGLRIPVEYRLQG